jgi:hypothetical protein
MTRNNLDTTYEKLKEFAEKHNIGDRILIATQPGTGRPDFIPLSEALMQSEPAESREFPDFIDYIGCMMPSPSKALVPLKD